jgi:hypothetical protein
LTGSVTAVIATVAVVVLATPAGAAATTTATARCEENKRAGRDYSSEQRSLEIHHRILVNATAANNPLSGLSLHRD